ncbi:MAG: RNA polymerase sigma factor [Ruminococcus sp.]|nr:RNA polymerase sigma factor [Ruminococcus sp.]
MNVRFEKLYEETKAAVMRYVSAHCYSITDIDDLFQDTYLAVYKSMQSLTEPIQSSEAYVIGVAKKVLARHYSAVRRLRAQIDVSLDRRSGRGLAEETADSVDVEKLAGDRELLDEIFELVTVMPVTVQRAFYMHYVLEMSFAEVGNELDLSEAAVRQRVARALTEIRRLYKRREQL